MDTKKLPGTMAASVAAGLALISYSAASSAQSAQESAMEDQMRVLQQQLDQLNQQLKDVRKTQQAQASSLTTVEKKADKAAKGPDKYDKFLKGFFGTLDASMDYTSKGIDQTSAYSWSYANPLDPSSGLVRGGNKGTATGRVGWIPALSSNGSNVGYRGSHDIAHTDASFIYQVATSMNIVASPGLRNSWTKSSNTVTGALGMGTTYIGFKSHRFGSLKFGTMFAPYKTSTDRLNPFGGQLGGYNTVMGNTGGDNRIEFGSRLDHAIIYNSPVMQGFSFDLMFAPGQNVNYNNVTIPLGSADCTGGNAPGSGNLFMNCDDGGYGDAYGGDIKFEKGGLYLTAAYEFHRNVNRNSDGIGSNSPQYAYLVATKSPLIDFGTYNAFAAEYPGAAAVSSPPYLTDIANEYAFKYGGQYRFAFGLSVDALYEHMFRSLPAALQFQNERERFGTWFALTQDFHDGRDQVAAGWAHAGRTPGDPAGQHNYNAYLQFVGDNVANSYTLSYKHKIDKQLTWYVDAAETINDGNAHYDIGAGGHGIKTDCHDGTNIVFNDYSSAGPTTWGGCHDMGISTGVDFKF